VGACSNSLLEFATMVWVTASILYLPKPARNRFWDPKGEFFGLIDSVESSHDYHSYYRKADVADRQEWVDGGRDDEKKDDDSVPEATRSE
jgi:hypothetical protein